MLKDYSATNPDTEQVKNNIKREIQNHPENFSAIYGINPYDSMEGVRELERMVLDHGFIGAHLVQFSKTSTRKISPKLHLILKNLC